MSSISVCIYNWQANLLACKRGNLRAFQVSHLTAEVLKVGSWTSCISITWELGKEANYWALAQIYWISNSRVRRQERKRTMTTTEGEGKGRERGTNRSLVKLFRFKWVLYIALKQLNIKCKRYYSLILYFCNEFPKW